MPALGPAGVLALGLLLALAGCANPAEHAPDAEVGDAAPEQAPAAEGTTYSIDAGSTISFVGAKVTGTHDGGFREFSGEITLVGGDLNGLVRARELSRATMRNIRQNLFFAFAYNTAGVPIAAGVLYPFFGVLLSPMIAAAAMSFSSVSVIANALRLRSAEI